MPKPNEFYPYHYRVLEIDLSNGLDNEKFQYGGYCIRYVEGVSRIYVKLNQNSEDQIPLFPGMEIRVPFTQFYLSADPFDETIKLHIYDPANMLVGLNAVNVHEVIHDQSAWRETELNRCFNVYGFCASNEGCYSAVQIKNPENSDVKIVLAEVLGVTSGTFYIGYYENDLSGSYNNFKLNALIGENLPIGEIKNQNDFTSNNIFDQKIYIYLRYDIAWKPYIIINPGKKLTFLRNTVNTGIGLYFKWYEIPI